MPLSNSNSVYNSRIFVCVLNPFLFQDYIFSDSSKAFRCNAHIGGGLGLVSCATIKFYSFFCYSLR